jgi:hypothetical protein
MGLFKSRDEREMERSIRIKQFLNKIRREIIECDRRMKTYVDFAKRAKQTGDAQSFATAKSGLKQTLVAKRLRERQLLHLQIAMTVRDQAAADVNFARAMKEVSLAITELVKSVNMTQIQMEYEKSMSQSEALKDQMEAFIDTASQGVQERDAQTEAVVKDDEIDKLIEAEVAKSEAEKFDAEIEKDLKDINRQLGEGQSENP